MHRCKCALVYSAHLAGDDGLHEKAEHGEHGEAAVLELLHLQLSKGVGVVSQTEGVKVVATCTKLVQHGAGHVIN